MLESTWGMNSELQPICVINLYSKLGDPEYPHVFRPLHLNMHPVGNDIISREEQDYSKLRVG